MTKPTNQTDMRRFILWGAQAVSTLIGVLLWTMIQEMKTEITALKNNQGARNEQLVKLEGVITRYGQDIAEVRASLTTMTNNLQEMRIGQSLLNQQLLEKSRR